jgi:hypothetical protein
MTGTADRVIRLTDPQAAIRAIRRAGHRVVTFVGFSGSGYEDQAGVERAIADILAELDPLSVLICSGATEEGIGAVYTLATNRGFATIGIVSSVAEAQGARFSDAVQTIYIIDDTQWGGRAPNGTLSPTSAAVVGAADEIVAIGGGDIARDEIEAAIGARKPVRYVAAYMNHAAAFEKVQRKGGVAPQDFKGPVHQTFSRDRMPTAKRTH